MQRRAIVRSFIIALIAVDVIATIACGHEPPTALDCTHAQEPTSSCCDVSTTCGSGECAPPGTPLACGICTEPTDPCTDDAACKATSATAICEPAGGEPPSCTCDDTRECVAGCTSDTACGEAETCDLATSRCVATTCGAGATCPADFTCTAGACARTTCTSDDDCTGYCVGGACYSTAGECREPVA